MRKLAYWATTLLMAAVIAISAACGGSTTVPAATIGAHGQPLADPTGRIATAE